MNHFCEQPISTSGLLLISIVRSRILLQATIDLKNVPEIKPTLNKENSSGSLDVGQSSSFISSLIDIAGIKKIKSISMMFTSTIDSFGLAISDEKTAVLFTSATPLPKFHKLRYYMIKYQAINIIQCDTQIIFMSSSKDGLVLSLSPSSMA